MIFTVLIPTYRRKKELMRCLEALWKQDRHPDEILVIIQGGDEETMAALEEIKHNKPMLRIVNIAKAGQIAALNAGLNEARGDIIAITDDDAVPHADWLKLIERRFANDPKLGGIGGRDWLYINGKLIEGEEKTVGRILWFGRIVGNHHLGIGKPRAVDHLKGVNMSFRREAIKGIHFDKSLRGNGAQYRNELGVCLEVKRRGWKLKYDPAIGVDHYIAKRIKNSQRGEFSRKAVQDEAFNEAMIVLKYFPFLKKITSITWQVICGDTARPGIFQIFRKLHYDRIEFWPRVCSASRGRRKALLKYLRESKFGCRIRIITAIIKHPLFRDNIFKGLLRVLKWQLILRFKKGPVLFRYVNNSRLLVKRGMHGIACSCYVGLAEFEEMSFLLHFLREGDFFVDIGAYMGAYTVLASAVRGARTLAIEPVPSTFSCLAENIRANRIADKVKALNIGAGSKECILPFTSSKGPMNHVIKYRKRHAEQISAHVKKLDKIIRGEIPILIKSDTEGSGLDVLRGAEETLGNNKLKALIIELWKDKKIHEHLVSKGFSIYTYDPFSRKLSRQASYNKDTAIYIRNLDFVKKRLEGAQRFNVLNRSI